MQLAKNRWYVVLTSDEVPANKPVGFRRLGYDLVFWRQSDGRIAAAEDRCPHRGVKLSIGKVQDGVLACPFHGFQFDGSGVCTRVPVHPDRPISPAMRLSSLWVAEFHDFVWVWTGDEAPDIDPPFFDFGTRTYAGSAMTADWDVHYTRAIENQLDFAHLSFVHANTIGRLTKEDDTQETFVDGDIVRSGGEDGSLELLGPNIWRLHTPPDQWQFIAFAPIDDTHMRYYMRIYSKPLPIPGLNWLFGKISTKINGIILGEDHRVMMTGPTGEVRPKEEQEVLTPSDSAIVAYRRWREELRGGFAPRDPRQILRMQRGVLNT